MPDLNIQFGQIPFWSICRSLERTKIEYVVFTFICAKRFRSNQEADCSRSEIIQYTGLDKSQVSVAIRNLIKAKWLEMKSKTRWFIPENEPEKVDDLSTNAEVGKVDESSTKVDELTTKVDDLSTPFNKDSDSSHSTNKNVANATGKLPNKPPKSRAKKSKESKDERSKHPAIAAVRRLMKRYPDELLWDKIINRFGENFDSDKLTKCRAEWLECGFNSNSMKWLNWYFDGIPERGSNGNQKPTETNWQTVGKSDFPDEPIEQPKPAPNCSENEKQQWDCLMASLQTNVNEIAFSSWFKPIVFEGIDYEQKLIKVSSKQMTKDWVNQNYFDAVVKGLQIAGMEDFNFDWKIEEGLAE